MKNLVTYLFTFVLTLCFPQNFARAGYDKVGVPELGHLPRIDAVRGIKKVEDRKVRILVFAIISGSSYKNQMDLATCLSNEVDDEGNPLYEVTFLHHDGEPNMEQKENARNYIMRIKERNMMYTLS